MSGQKALRNNDRLFQFAQSIGCKIENGSKHFKIQFNGRTLLVISRSREGGYDIPAQERKLQRMVQQCLS